jgi:cytochrome c oxidase subunit IV
MVDYLNFEGTFRWTLIVIFMLSKAALIMAIFMHLFWERYAIINVLLWPMTLMLLFVLIMVAESEYTLLTRLFYFVAGS